MNKVKWVLINILIVASLFILTESIIIAETYSPQIDNRYNQPNNSVIPDFSDDFFKFGAFILISTPVLMQPIISLLNNKKKFSIQMHEMRLNQSQQHIDKYRESIKKLDDENQKQEIIIKELTELKYTNESNQKEVKTMIKQCVIYLQLIKKNKHITGNDLNLLEAAENLLTYLLDNIAKNPPPKQ